MQRHDDGDNGYTGFYAPLTASMTQSLLGKKGINSVKHAKKGRRSLPDQYGCSNAMQATKEPRRIDPPYEPYLFTGKEILHIALAYDKDKIFKTR